MGIDFITKNKIAAYGTLNADAYIYFITWLKEFRVKELTQSTNHQTIKGPVNGWAQLGASNYSIKFQINPWLKTGYIIFFGNKEDEALYNQQELEKIRANNPDEKIVVKTHTVIIKGNSGLRQNLAVKLADIQKVVLPSQPGDLFYANGVLAVANGAGFKIEREYEEALDRAATIFDARPEMPEFNELALLLPLIKKHENENIRLPTVNTLDAIRLRVRDFNMTPENLIYIMGSLESVELFFAGKKVPTKAVIAKLYRTLGLKLPVKRDDFIVG